MVNSCHISQMLPNICVHIDHRSAFRLLAHMLCGKLSAVVVRIRHNQRADAGEKRMINSGEDDAKKVLKALARNMPEDERLVLCGFKGDPNEAPANAWQPRPWKIGADVPFGPQCNAYVTVAAFGRAPDSGFRRRRDTFKAGLALMIDDVGTKVDPAKVNNVEPTFIIETSPANFQHSSKVACWAQTLV